MANGDVQQSEPGKWQRILRLLSQGGARFAAGFGHPQALQMEQERDQQRKLAEQEEYQRAIQRRAETRAESAESRAQGRAGREAGLYGLRHRQLGQVVSEGERKAEIAPQTYDEVLRRTKLEAEAKRAPVTDTSTSLTELRMMAAQGTPVAIAALDRMEKHQKGLRASTAGPREATPGQRAMLKQRMDKALRDAEADFLEGQGDEFEWEGLGQAGRQKALDRLRKLKQRIHDDFEGQQKILTGGAEIGHVTVPRQRARPDAPPPPKEGWLPDWLTGLFGDGQQPAPAPPITPTSAPQNILKTTPPPLPSVLTEDRVRVIDAQGNTGTIPRSQLEAALQQGYRVVE